MLTAGTPQYSFCTPSGPAGNNQAVCFNRGWSPLLVALGTLLPCDFSPLSLFVPAHTYNALNHSWGGEPPSSSSGKHTIFLVSVLLCPRCPARLCTARHFHAQHKNAGYADQNFLLLISSYSDFHFGTLCFCFRNLFVRTGIRPAVPLTNLTLPSGWLSHRPAVLLSEGKAQVRALKEKSGTARLNEHC